MAFLRHVVRAATPPKYAQPHFRIRNSDTVGLNSDSDWAGALDANVSMDVEKAFRIRFEVEELNNVSEAGTAQFYLQWRKNGGAWSIAIPQDYPAAAATPAVATGASSQFSHNDGTTNLLSGSGLTFQTGGGSHTHAASLPVGDFKNEHTEFEFTVRIRRHYDGGRNDAGDIIEFRLVEDVETPFQGTYVIPAITLTIPVGLIGGTLVETPSKVGPFKDGNGNLYYIHERAETNNIFLISKSTDGGDTWVDVDTVNRPTKGDLEAVDAFLANDRLYILHCQTPAVWHHIFRVSTHATNPDTWETKDEELEPSSVPDQVPSRQVAGIVRRSDGDLVAFYIFNNGTNTQVYYKIKPSAGAWGSRIQLDAEAVNFLGLGVCLGNSDKTHIVYNDDAGNVWHRSLDSADTLSSRESLTTTGLIGSGVDNDVVPPVAWDEAGTEKVLVGYCKSDSKIYSRIITNDGAPGSESAAITATTVQRNKGASHAVAFTLAVDGSNVSILYGDLTTEDIFYDENLDEAGWGTDVEEKDAVACHNITGQIYTHSAPNGSQKVFGYVFEDGTDGYTGGLKYAERVFATPITAAVNTAMKLAAVGAAVSVSFAPLAPSSVASPLQATGQPQAGYVLNAESVAPLITITGEGQALLNVSPESIQSSASTGEPSVAFAPLAPEGVSPPLQQTGEPVVAVVLSAQPEGIADSAHTGEPAATFAPLAPESVADAAHTGEPNAGYTLNAESVPSAAQTGEPAALLTVAPEGIPSSARTGEPSATFAPLEPEGVPSSARTGEPEVTSAAALNPESIPSSARTGSPSATFASLEPESAGAGGRTGEPAASLQAAPEGVGDSARTGEPAALLSLSPESVPSSAGTGEPSLTYAAVAPESVGDGARVEAGVVASSGLNAEAESIPSSARTGEPAATFAALAPESVPSSAATGEPQVGATLNAEGVRDSARTGEASVTFAPLEPESVPSSARTGEPTASLPQTIEVEGIRDTARTGEASIIQGLITEVSSGARLDHVGEPRIDTLTPPERTARVYTDPRGVIVLRENRGAEAHPMPSDRTGTIVP